MKTDADGRSGLGRREFIRAAGALSGMAILPTSTVAAKGDANGHLSVDAEDTPLVYMALGPDEAAFVEHMVEVMCPPDDLTPGGVECGLAVFIDRQLAGGYGQGERLFMHGPWRPGQAEDGYQLPMTPVKFFKLGLAAADSACRKFHGRKFSLIPTTDADLFLQDLAAGAVSDDEVDLGAWFNELVYPLFTQACFADPVYGGNRDKIFWKMIGYPGLPAVNGLNMSKYRGKPFPGATNPLSMEDFS